MSLRGRVLTAGAGAAALGAGLYAAYAVYSASDPDRAFWYSAAVLIAVAFVLMLIGAALIRKSHLGPLLRLKKTTEDSARLPLANAFPELKIDTDNQTAEYVRELYAFMRDRHKSLQQVLHYSSLASHELRTPLTIIRNQLEDGFRGDISFEDLKSIVASTYDEIIRLHHLVNDLLTISTMQSGTIKLDVSEIRFPEFIKEFYDEALLLSREKDVSVVLARGEPAAIQGDRNRLRQLLFNLFDNALKFTPGGGKIHFSYEVRGGRLHIRIADTGPGIPNHQLNRIFEPFYQIDRHGETHQGAGLGLSLVRWIAEAHRGTVVVESEEGKGTVFIISLPIQ
jgi:signal transduction histidine kinase